MLEFPELNPDSPAYNKKFYEEVGAEISARVKRGRNSEDLDLIYDAASAVAVRGTRDGWYLPKKAAERERHQQNARTDSFEVKGGSSPKGTPTEGQLKIASRFGMNPERITQLLKKTGEIR